VSAGSWAASSTSVLIARPGGFSARARAWRSAAPCLARPGRGAAFRTHFPSARRARRKRAALSTESAGLMISTYIWVVCHAPPVGQAPGEGSSRYAGCGHRRPNQCWAGSPSPAARLRCPQVPSSIRATNRSRPPGPENGNENGGNHRGCEIPPVNASANSNKDESAAVMHQIVGGPLAPWEQRQSIARPCAKLPLVESERSRQKRGGRGPETRQVGVLGDRGAQRRRNTATLA